MKGKTPDRWWNPSWRFGLAASVPVIIPIAIAVAGLTINMVHNTVLDAIKAKPDVRYMQLQDGNGPVTIRAFNYLSHEETLNVDVLIAGPLGGLVILAGEETVRDSMDSLNAITLLDIYLGLDQWYQHLLGDSRLVPLAQVNRATAFTQYIFLDSIRAECLRLAALLADPKTAWPSAEDIGWVYPLFQALTRDSNEKPRPPDPDELSRRQRVRQRLIHIHNVIIEMYTASIENLRNAGHLKSVHFYTSDNDGIRTTAGARLIIPLRRKEERSLRIHLQMTHRRIGRAFVSRYISLSNLVVSYGAKNLATRVHDPEDLVGPLGQTEAVVSYYESHWLNIFRLLLLILLFTVVASAIPAGLITIGIRLLSRAPSLVGAESVRRSRPALFRSTREGVLWWNVNNGEMPPPWLLTAASCPIPQKRVVAEVLHPNNLSGVHECLIGPFQDAPYITSINFAFGAVGDQEPSSSLASVPIIDSPTAARCLADLAAIGVVSSVVLVYLLIERVASFALYGDVPLRIAVTDITSNWVPAFLVLALPVGLFGGIAWRSSTDRYGPRNWRWTRWALLAITVAVVVFAIYDQFVPDANFEAMKSMVGYRRTEPLSFARYIVGTETADGRRGVREMSLRALRNELRTNADKQRGRLLELEIAKRVQLPMTTLFLLPLGITLGALLTRIAHRNTRMLALAVAVALVGSAGLAIYSKGETLAMTGYVPSWAGTALFNALLTVVDLSLFAWWWIWRRRTSGD